MSTHNGDDWTARSMGRAELLLISLVKGQESRFDDFVRWGVQQIMGGLGVTVWAGAFILAGEVL